MPIPRLSDAERDAALADLPGWTLRQDGLAIRRTLKFADFTEAFAFMTRVALQAEKADHHPEWFNVWNRGHHPDHPRCRWPQPKWDVALARVIDGFV